MAKCHGFLLAILNIHNRGFILSMLNNNDVGKFLLIQSVDTSQNAISGIDRHGKKHDLNVKEPWSYFLKYLDERSEIFIESTGDTIDDSGLLVVNPSVLIPVTGIVDSMSCSRRSYIKFLGSEDTPSRNLMQRITEGNLLHDVFALKMQNLAFKESEIIDTVIQLNRPKIISLALNEEALRTYLDKNIVAFNLLNLQGRAEVDCQNWKHGVHGKFDGLQSSSLIELKTSKIPEGDAWREHGYQLGIYKSIIEDRGKYNGKVLYLNNGRMSLKEGTPISRIEWIVARNMSYLIYTNQLIPPVLRGKPAIACDHCFVREGCQILCAGLATQRDCGSCTHNLGCDKKIWPTEDLVYYTRFASALIHEELEDMRAQYLLSRVGIQNNNQTETLIQRGYALLLGKLIEQRFENGKYNSQFHHNTEINRFRRGDRVRVFDQSELNDYSTLYLSATIEQISDNHINLISSNPIQTNSVIVSSDTSSNLKNARKSLFKAMRGEITLLDKIRSPDLPSFPITHKLNKPLKKYNENQRNAILLACSTPDFFLIQGPAGTGKTSVIIEVARQLFLEGKQVIVTAYTNMAVDNVGLNLIEEKIPFIRLGNIHSMNEELREYSLDFRQKEFLEALEENLPLILLSTTSSLSKAEYSDLFLDYVILDEAAQMTEPESLKAIIHAQRCILVGDHMQLQPIIKSEESIKRNLHVSLFERLVNDSSNRFIILTEQYRMNDEILSFPNRAFYQGKLKSANSEVARRNIDVRSEIVTSSSYGVISLIDGKIDTNSQVNTPECLIILDIIAKLLKQDIEPGDIGIITPFRAQVARLRELLPGLAIDTIDRFQGSEKEIILFSTITPAAVPILSDHRRMNVALTRARSKLIVIMSNPTPKGKSLVNQLYSDAVERNCIIELTNNDISKYIGQEHVNTSLEFIQQLMGIEKRSLTITEATRVKTVGIYFGTILLTSIEVENEICIICYQPLNSGVACIGCSYYFHEDHLVSWVKKSRSCPVCRHSLTLQEF